MKTKTKSKAPKQNPAIALQHDLLSNTQDINNVLSSSNKVSPSFHGHYFNMESGKNGIESLILEILSEHEAIFPSNIGNTSLRTIAISASMFTSEIIEQVQSRFSNGSKRYPYNTIHQYLSIFMTRSGKVGKIKLSNSEDKPRPCFKPRTKWFIIQ